jgi:hypothetical protein
MAACAWALNLDADLELAAGARYDLRKSLRLAMKPHIERLAASLLCAGDVLVDDESAPGIAEGLPGRAFCPTPRALAILRRAGAQPEPHPSVDVLRRVNSRAFATSLGTTLAGAAFVTEMEVARAMLGTEPPEGDAWRVKHAFGMAGRNQRLVTPRRVDGRALGFVQAGLALGGVQIEPNVRIAAEYAQHGVLAGDGSIDLGAPVRQRCDAHGAWLASEPVPVADLGDLTDRLDEECRRVAHALLTAGYFGPFGVDAFTYRGRAGALLFQPRSEINARYSMGFAAGWGRPAGASHVYKVLINPPSIT